MCFGLAIPHIMFSLLPVPRKFSPHLSAGLITGLLKLLDEFQQKPGERMESGPRKKPLHFFGTVDRWADTGDCWALAEVYALLRVIIVLFIKLRYN